MLQRSIRRRRRNHQRHKLNYMNGYIEGITLILVSIAIGYFINRLGLIEQRISKAESKVLILENRMADIKNI